MRMVKMSNLDREAINPAERQVAQYMVLSIINKAGGSMQASRLTGIPQNSIWYWRYGRKVPNRGSFRRIQEAYERLKDGKEPS